MKILKYSVLLCVFAFLVGCSHQSKEVYLVRHPEKLKSTLLACNAMPAEQARKSEKCMFAAYVYSKAVLLSKELVANQEEFGRKILVLQMQQADIKAQIKKLENAGNKAAERKIHKLKIQYKQISRDIAFRLALQADSEKL